MNYNKLIFELTKENRKGYTLPKLKENNNYLNDIPKELLRTSELKLPEVSENDVVRHYTLLSTKNYGVDSGFYPLGSCTMKYNPKINEDMASLDGFLNIHPYQPTETVQGALELMYNLSDSLCEITGMDDFTLQPAAGAHGELTGLMLIKAYHENRGDINRTKIIVPDSAHGTNPASAHMAGFDIVEIKSNKDGSLNIDALKEVLGDDTAGLMLTNPSTLGLFETNIAKIAKLVHDAGGQLYYDGANMNAIMGVTRPGDMGFDVVHLNIHKTFSTPHGGGGPGSGTVGVKRHLAEFLPTPIVIKNKHEFELNYDLPNSIGSVKGFYGNFGVLVKAYTYILMMGAEGLTKASKTAVLNANYLQNKLKKYYKLPLDIICKHEFVLEGISDKLSELSTLDVAKRLMDYGFHPPTIFFPLIVNQAMMFEPTESESLDTLDDFIKVMIKISEEIKDNPEVLKNAPHNTPVRRLDEVTAAKKPILTYYNH